MIKVFQPAKHCPQAGDSKQLDLLCIACAPADKAMFAGAIGKPVAAGMNSSSTCGRRNSNAYPRWKVDMRIGYCLRHMQKLRFNPARDVTADGR